MNKIVNVLLVEDDEVDILNVKRAFKANNVNYPLIIASDGEQALNFINHSAENSPLSNSYVVLMDINMPKMSGIECLKQIRSDQKIKKTCVFILTTSSSNVDLQAAYNLNVAGYILKPIDYNQFVSVISRLSAYWEVIEVA